jgi:CheY-like chemotaxis protein
MSKNDSQPNVAPQQSQAHSRPRILVADDEPCIRALMSAVLRHAGYRVDTVQDGVLAWAALQAEPYELLITDYNMPRATGIDLVRNLRSAHMNLPVIMVTGALPVGELAQNPSLRLAATLEKPFDVAELLDAVGKTLAAAISPHEPIRVRA